MELRQTTDTVIWTNGSHVSGLCFLLCRMGIKKHLAHNSIIVLWMKWRHDHKLLSAIPGTQ